MTEEVKAIINGYLINGTGGKPVKDATVLVKGNKIEAVGKKSKVKIPDDAEAIDAESKTIMPGMI